MTPHDDQGGARLPYSRLGVPHRLEFDAPTLWDRRARRLRRHFLVFALPFPACCAFVASPPRVRFGCGRSIDVKIMPLRSNRVPCLPIPGFSHQPEVAIACRGKICSWSLRLSAGPHDGSGARLTYISPLLACALSLASLASNKNMVLDAPPRSVGSADRGSRTLRGDDEAVGIGCAIALPKIRSGRPDRAWILARCCASGASSSAEIRPGGPGLVWSVLARQARDRQGHPLHTRRSRMHQFASNMSAGRIHPDVIS